MDSTHSRVAFGYELGFVLYTMETKAKLRKELDYATNLIRFTHENSVVTLTGDHDDSTRLAVWRTSTSKI